MVLRNPPPSPKSRSATTKLIFKFFSKSRFPYPYFIAIHCDHTYFNLWVLLDLSWKYERFTPSGSKEMRIRKFEFVAKTQFFPSCMYTCLAKYSLSQQIWKSWAVNTVYMIKSVMQCAVMQCTVCTPYIPVLDWLVEETQWLTNRLEVAYN